MPSDHQDCRIFHAENWTTYSWQPEKQTNSNRTRFTRTKPKIRRESWPLVVALLCAVPLMPAFCSCPFFRNIPGFSSRKPRKRASCWLLGLGFFGLLPSFSSQKSFGLVFLDQRSLEKARMHLCDLNDVSVIQSQVRASHYPSSWSPPYDVTNFHYNIQSNIPQPAIRYSLSARSFSLWLIIRDFSLLLRCTSEFSRSTQLISNSISYPSSLTGFHHSSILRSLTTTLVSAHFLLSLQLQSFRWPETALHTSIAQAIQVIDNSTTTVPYSPTPPSPFSRIYPILSLLPFFHHLLTCLLTYSFI